MRAMIILVIGILVSGCALNNDCAVRGAQFGYAVGVIKTNNIVMANAYSLYGRVNAAHVCD